MIYYGLPAIWSAEVEEEIIAAVGKACGRSRLAGSDRSARPAPPVIIGG